jgi:ferrous iron transport protein A
MGRKISNFDSEQKKFCQRTDSEAETRSEPTDAEPPRWRQEAGKGCSLRDVSNGRKVRILSLPRGESGARLEALGIRPGKIVTKLSGMPFSGPVALELDGRQIAVGHGVSRAILVEEVPEP